MRQLAMLLLLAAGAFAQNAATPPSNPQAAPPDTPKEDLCTLEGHVFNLITGEPLAKARVSMNRADLLPNSPGGQTTYSTVSDSAGKFAMKDLEPGQYRLNVTHTGYLSMPYGARAPGRTGGVLTLSRAQHIKDVDFRLTPHGSVSGRITDADGDPPAELLAVDLVRQRYVNGKKQLSSSNLNYTDDRGEFRIYGVPPGKYYIHAYLLYNNAGNQIDRSASDRPAENEVPTFYPGTQELVSAAQIDVKPGAENSGINFRMSRARSYHVKGTVSQTSMPGNTPITVTMAPRDDANTVRSGIMMGPRGVVADAKGRFELPNVVPGSYVLRATMTAGAKSRSGRAFVEVTNQNVDNVQAVIGLGIDVTGQVGVEQDQNQPLGNVIVRLSSGDLQQGGLIAGSVSTSRLDENLKFHMDGVSPEKYDVAVSNLPAGYYLKSIRADQTDVLLSGLDLTRGTPPALTVVLSSKAGQVTGTVQNPNTNQGAPSATVVLIPQEKERHDLQSFYKTANTDQNGNFTMIGLAPGEYKVYAWEDLETGAYMDPDVLKPVESKGTAVKVQEGSKESVVVTLIPADSPGQKAKGQL